MKLGYDYLFLLFVIILTSCSTTRDGAIYQSLQEDQIEAGIIEAEDFTIDIAYIGAIGHSYVFECTIENKSNEAMKVDKSQFHMSISDERIVKSADAEVIVSNLKQDQRRLKKQRKTNTILGVISIGLAAISGSTQGLTAGEALLINAEPIIYIFDERRWYNRDIKSIDDEIEYIRAAQFDDYRLGAQSAVTRDLLFPTTKVRQDVDVIFNYGQEEYIITFPKKIFR